MINSGYRLIALLLLFGSILFLFQSTLCAGEVFYENPVIPGDHPDPSIIRVGRDYWATSTSSEWGPQFPLLHSRDLVNWEQTGNVFAHRPAWADRNFWAPEISQIKGRYYVYYVGHMKGGALAVAVATADKPSGPYTDHGPIISQPHGSIDPVPCTDEHGKLYLVWKDDNNSARLPTTIWAQPLTDDGLKLTGEPTALIHNDADWEGPLVEGPYVLRRGNWFYLFYSGNGCCGTNCHYGMGVARSHCLLGPWEKNPANPIITGNDRWKCPGHGSIVTDERGRYWLLYHAYSTISSVYTGREAVLDEVTFGRDDWPVVNGGMGPAAKAISPYGAAQSRTNLAFMDNFSEKRLDPGWQWPQDHEPVCDLHGGKLFLSGHDVRPTNSFAAVLARSTLTGNYTAVTQVELASLPAGCLAGLSAVGDENHAIGLSIGKYEVGPNGQRMWTQLILWRLENGVWQPEQMDAPKAKMIQLRMVARDGYKFNFAASTNGENWTPVGSERTGKKLPPWDRSVRVGLTVIADTHQAAGFDFFRMTPDSP